MNRLILLSVLFFLSITAKILPQVENIYVGMPGTGPGGTDPAYSTLREACEDLDSLGWVDEPSEINIIVTSNLTEPAGVQLSLPKISSSGDVTLNIHPLEGTDPIITFLESMDTAITQYGWYLNTWRARTNVSELTFQGDSASYKNIIPLKIDGGNGFNTYGIIEDCNFYYRSKFADSTVLACAVYLTGTDTYINDSYINADNAWAPYTTGVFASVSDGSVSDCKIEAKKTGVEIRGGRYGDVTHCEIIMNQDLANINITGIDIRYFLGSKVERNKILLSKNNFSKASGAIGIMHDIALVNNNMITGFYLDDNSKTPSSELVGIVFPVNYWEANYNTIKMNDLCVSCDGKNPAYYGIKVLGQHPINNNIIINEENDIPSFCIFFEGELFRSDYNNLKTSGNVSYTGYYNGTPAVTLNDWQALTGQDSNSVSIEVSFVSDTDLHLTGSSIGDNLLSGIPIVGIKYDIDNDTRDTLYPYMGADEADVPLTARVISSVAGNILPENFDLMQNYPNPFNPATKIVYNLPNDAHVKLEVISITGEVVKVLLDEYKSAGSHTSYFTANNYASGTYIYRLTAGKEVISRKMLLLK